MNAEQDRELVKRILAGDDEAEKEIFTRYEKKLAKKMIFFAQGNGDDWKYLLSDLHFTLLKNLRAGKYDPERGELNYYINGIAKNIFRNYLKQKTIMNARRPISEDYDRAKEEFDMEERERNELLEELLNTLEPKYRKVLNLKYYEGLKAGEIAAKINLPSAEVSNLLHYAIELLKKKCENDKYFSILPLVLTIGM